MIPLGFTKGYGLPDEYRWRVIHYADIAGRTAAALHFNLSYTAVARWQKAAQQIRNSPELRRPT